MAAQGSRIVYRYQKWCLLLFVVVIIEILSANGDYCDDNRNNVTLEILNGEDACPSDPITLRCAVKKSPPTSSFLTWKCTSNSSGNLVLCGPILNFTCTFGKVFNISGACQCDGGNVIVSEALFLAKRPGPMTLFCGNGMEKDDKEISVSPRGLHTPELTYKKMSDDQEGPVKIRVMWTTPDSTMRDITYKLTLENSSYSTTWTTYQPYRDMTVYTGISYNVTVFAERCNGALRSGSNSTTVLFQDHPSSTSSGEEGRTTEGTRKKTEGLPKWTIAVIVLLAVLIVLVGFIGLICILILCYRKKHKKRKTAIKGNLFFSEEKILGKGFTSDEENKYRTEDIKSTKRTSNGALYADEVHIYYSCHERCNDGKWEYTLHKRSIKDGADISTVVGFNHIRGIGRDSVGNTYVVDSNHSIVVKFNSGLIPIRKTDVKTQLLPTPYGLLVKGSFVFVCENKTNKLIILDHSLNLYCEIYHHEHNYLLVNPTGITELDGMYFVTCYAAIVAIDINYEDKTFGAHKMKSMKTSNGEERFNSRRELRGICSDHQYLYVTESKQRLLCLRYDAVSETLELVDSIDCSPLVIASNGTDIFFSRTESDESCHIARLERDNKDKLTYKNIFKL